MYEILFSQGGRTLLYAIAWMKFEDLMLGEISQSQKSYLLYDPTCEKYLAQSSSHR